MEGTYVDAEERNEEGKLVSNLLECPDELLTFVTHTTSTGISLWTGFAVRLLKVARLPTMNPGQHTP